METKTTALGVASIDQPLRDLVALFAASLRLPMATISLPDQDHVLNRWGLGIADARRPCGDTICDLVLRSGRVLRIDDIHKAPEVRARLKPGDPPLRFYVGFPLRDHVGQVAGVLCGLDLVPRSLSEDDLQLAESFARMAENILRTRAAEESMAGALRAARGSAATLLAVLEGLPLAVISKDVKQDFRFVVWNKHSESLFGRRREEVIGKTDFDLFERDDAAFFRSKDLEAMAGRQILEIPEESLTTDRGERVLRTRKIPIFDEKGDAEYLVVICEDITEIKRQALEAQEARLAKKSAEAFASLAEAIPQMVWTVAPSGVIDYANARWRPYVKPTDDGFEIDVEKIHPDDRMSFLSEWLRCSRTGTRFEAEFRLWSAEVKDYRWQLARAVPIADAEGRLLRWFATGTDIHSQKQMERERAAALARESAALESSRLKSEFLANMSHEIRTPLNGIIGMCQLLLETRMDQTQSEYLKTLDDSSNLLLRLINDILDFSRIEAGEFKIERGQYSPGAIADEVYRHFRFQADVRRLALRFDVDPKIPLSVEGDALRIRQVLMNLIGNAMKFTEKGSIDVTLRWKEPGTLHVSVKDTGIGIPPEIRGRLFKKFSQGDASTTKKYGGTGLGLVISKNLVELMGGVIGVQSEASEGSEFWFEVPCPPVASAAPPAKPAPASSAVAAPTESTLPKILLVEDNDVNRRVLSSFLPSHRFRIDFAMNGEEALTKSRGGDYALILMDCQMPVMDGYEATRRIRSEEGISGRHVPIVAVTANAMAGDRERCLAAGMDDYLSKPIKKALLLEMIDHWLAGSAKAG